MRSQEVIPAGQYVLLAVPMELAKDYVPGDEGVMYWLPYSKTRRYIHLPPGSRVKVLSQKRLKAVRQRWGKPTSPVSRRASVLTRIRWRSS